MCEYTLGCSCHDGDVPVCINGMRRSADRLPKSLNEKLKREDDSLKQFIEDVKQLCHSAQMVMHQSNDGSIIIFDPDAEDQMMDLLRETGYAKTI